MKLAQKTSQRTILEWLSSIYAFLEQMVGIYCQEVEPEPEEESTLEMKIKETEVLAMLTKLQLYEEGQEVKNNKLLTEIC